MSAVLSAKGNPARILDDVLEEGPHDFDLCAPSQLFPKVEDVLARPKTADRLKWGRGGAGKDRASVGARARVHTGSWMATSEDALLLGNPVKSTRMRRTNDDLGPKS